MQRVDPVTWVLLVHGVVLAGLERVLYPGWVVAATVGLAVWRVGLGLVGRRSGGRRGEMLGLLRSGGSLVLAAVAMAADGGTESPLFFWPILILAWQALVFPLGGLAVLTTLALLTYLVVVVGVPDVTPSSVARLGLLVAFCGVLLIGRLRLEELQREAVRADRLLQDTFSAAPVGLALVALDPVRVVFANQSAIVLGLEELFAADKEEGEGVRSLVTRAAQTRQPVGPEVLVLHPTGAGPRHLRILATPHILDGEEGAVVCCEDVTVQVMVGEERRRFLQLASHQLRTPLTPIIAYAQMLKDRTLDGDDVAEAAEEILVAGWRLERLFDRMATVTRLQHGSQRNTIGVAVGAILADVQRRQPDIMEGVETTGDRRLMARCHLESVARALGELLDNGHRFGQAPVRLSWVLRNEMVEFWVSDAGDGPSDDLSREEIFSGWGQRGNIDIMPSGMGTNLGLLQARLLVELAGGTLTLHRAGDGWAFVVRLKADQSKVSNRHGVPDAQATPVPWGTPLAAGNTQSSRL